MVLAIVGLEREFRYSPPPSRAKFPAMVSLVIVGEEANSQSPPPKEALFPVTVLLAIAGKE
jgi:hypothetical protein